MFRAGIALVVTITLLAIIACTAPWSPANEEPTIIPAVAGSGAATEPFSPLPTPTSTRVPPAWTRHVDTTGISFEIPPEWGVDNFYPGIIMLQPEGGSTPEQANAATIRPLNSEWPFSYQQMQIFTWSATHPGREPQESTFPYHHGYEGGYPLPIVWLAPAPTTRIQYYVAPNGLGWNERQPGADECCGSINAWVINLGCRMEASFSAFFGAPGPVEALETMPLDKLVAEQFPTFDRMVRSVEFPPPCNDDPLLIPTEWEKETNDFGISIDIPTGYDDQWSSDKFIGGTQEIQDSNIYAASVAPNVAAENLRVETRRNLNAAEGAPVMRFKSGFGSALVSTEVAMDANVVATLTLYGDSTTLDGTRFTPSTIGVRLVATIPNEKCATSTAIHGWLEVGGVEEITQDSLEKLVAERAPIFDRAFRSLRYPENCVETP